MNSVHFDDTLSSAQMGRHYQWKCFTSLELALRIRDFVREYMELDEHCVGKPDCSYPVHTIHLDSDDWRMYWQTIRRDQDRWKLRLRYFDNHPESPVFCEVKHQQTDVITKYRGGMSRLALDDLMAGRLPDRQQLASKEVKQSMAVERFVGLMLEVNARPKFHISCLREAYVSFNDRCRVTLDRCIGVRELSDDLLATRMDDPLIYLDHVVVVVLRFVERYPDWYRDLIQVFHPSQSFPWLRGQRTIACAGLRLTPGDLINNIVL